jgi:gamma-glutamylcyclotransferase (GGCT)/AIG2-like uncharacterized protein YtfP
MFDEDARMSNEEIWRTTASGPGLSEKINLFVYGSLMYEPVWRRLVASEFERKAAQLTGYRRLKIKNEDYPGLVKGIGTVHGIVWLAVDEQTLQRIDEFEADCYRRISGVVVDGAGAEIPAYFFVIKESDAFMVEDAEWDVQEFERNGLSHFIDSYVGFTKTLSARQVKNVANVGHESPIKTGLRLNPH